MTTKPKARKFRIRRLSPLIAGLRGGGTARAASAEAEAEAQEPVAQARSAPAPGAARATIRAARAGQLGGRPATAAAAPAQPAPRPAPRAAQPAAPDFDLDTTFDTQDDGFGPMTVEGSASAAPAASPDAEIDAIRREGLTGRQLRMARRVAQKHGLAPTSDFDAVRQLRQRGIDPFERSTMLELVIPSARGTSPPQLPQTVSRPQLPSTRVLSEDARAAEIRKIQRDIARRRRRKLALLATRLAFFVALPTLIAAWYYYAIATPLYATKSEFVIQKAEGQSSGLGSLFSGTQFATTQDSITVQSYLMSRDAMLRLDEEVGFKSHFQQPWIDPVKRLAADATNEDAYRLYQQNVEIGFDPTEGIIKMEVVAADPETSRAFSLALISYAEEQVDHLTQRQREDQMAGARESFADAEVKMQQAQARVLELQEKLGVLDPATETSSLMAQISTFETQLQEKRLELQQLLDNARPNRARVSGVEGDIARLETLIRQLRSQLTTSGADSTSLAQITGQLRMAELDLQTRQAMMAQAMQQMETARIEANRQVRYLELGVRPVAPDEPTYPRKFENTLLVMLIFAGIYLMISLTASILREQVTA